MDAIIFLSCQKKDKQKVIDIWVKTTAMLASDSVVRSGWAPNKKKVFFIAENDDHVHPFRLPNTRACCTNPNCKKIQDDKHKFMRCSGCYSSFCSTRCQSKSWDTHKSYCKSWKAYVSKLDHFENHLPFEIRWTSHQGNNSLYCEAWNQWSSTNEFKKLLKQTGLTMNDVRPSIDNILPPFRIKNLSNGISYAH